MEITKKIYLIFGTLFFTGIVLTILGFLLAPFLIGVPLLVVGLPSLVIGAIGIPLLIPAIGFETAKALTKSFLKNRAKIAYGLFHKPTPEETKEAREKLKKRFFGK